MTELAHSKLKYGLFSTVISCHDGLAQNCYNLWFCAGNVYTDTSSWTTPLVDSNINDRLVKLHPLVHLTCFEFMWIIVVSYSEGRLFHITHLVNCMYLAHSIELINQI